MEDPLKGRTEQREGRKVVMLCVMFVILFPAGGFPYELTEGDIICVFSQ